MGKVDFIVIDTLGNYIGKGGTIEVWEFNLYLQRLPIKLIRSDGKVEDILCSFKLTEFISDDPTVLKYLPYFEVIETSLGRKSISSNRVNEKELNLIDYEIIIHSLEETSEILRNQIEKK